MFRDLQSRILHLPASNPSETNPLSADVYAIRGDTAWWIFDVGACDEAADFVNNLPCVGVAPGAAPLKKNIIISHFHRDHFFNLSRVSFDNLYVGRETFRHCDENIRARSGTQVVESPLQFEDGLRFRIEPIPSSHAKGSLMLSVGDDIPDRDCCGEQSRGAIAFLGDSTYPTVNHNGPDFYNLQLLYQQIQFLRSCPAQLYYMSHRRPVPREKESVLQVLVGYYAQRQPNKNLIEVSR
ncbi:glyoxylase-like metal-dependent hydrolase (beta-lactamase superfamily II) [Fibrobacter sp. UWR4]|nr:glyoxylase-like metal-dependent hydrolase (beta-lactamase superfamily II) [Fibrobacter sp. UWR4]PZW73438.1 glyoxylase-like metal-dependent hydrolase (beta-lactamase superfamily II) [Fibrobacter sp. UWR1]